MITMAFRFQVINRLNEKVLFYLAFYIVTDDTAMIFLANFHKPQTN